MRIKITKLPHAADLDLPAYATEHAAGLDLVAALDGDALFLPGERGLIPTGIAIAIPVGFEGQIRPRSGLALRHGITVLNAPGTIDADYRAEVGVVLVNHGTMPFTIKRGMRIAQMVISLYVRADLEWVEQLPPTGRGMGGFGSTGQ